MLAEQTVRAFWGDVHSDRIATVANAAASAIRSYGDTHRLDLSALIVHHGDHLCSD